MALTYQTTAAQIHDDEAMLAKVQQAIVDVLTVGQSYSIAGSRTFTAADLPELRKMEHDLRARVLRRKGVTGKNLADMSRDTTGSDNVPSP